MSTRHPSDLTWTNWLAGELGWLEAWRFRRHVRACETCRALEADERAERTRIQHELDRELPGLRDQVATAPGPRRSGGRWSLEPRWLLAGGLTAAVAVLAVVMTPRVVTRDPEPAPFDESSPLSSKGLAQLDVFLQRGDHAVALGSTCAVGDRLLARWRTGYPYLLVLERDGSGAIQVLFPLDGARSAQVGIGAGTTPKGWLLDAIPGEECFAAFFSDEPLDAGAASSALSASPRAPQLAGAHVQVHCCRKEATP